MKFPMLALVASLTLIVGCQKNDGEPPKTNVQIWGEETVSDLGDIYPASFKGISNDFAIVDEMDFTELDLRYDTASNGQLSLKPEDKNLIFKVGIISAVAEHCEMDWAAQNFLPMMQWQRSLLPASERNGYQIAVVGVIHGIAQQGTADWLMSNDALCGDARELLSGNLYGDQF